MEKCESLRDPLELETLFLEDGIFSGKTEDVKCFYELLCEKGEDFGLFLKKKKCKLRIGEGVSEEKWMKEMEILKKDDLVVLGVPIGDVDFINKIMAENLVEWREFLNMLPRLEDPQLAVSMLRDYADVSKVVYSLRIIPPSLSKEWTKEFDKSVRVCLESILGRSLSDRQFGQVSLSTKLGGLGVRISTRIHSAAWLSSHFAVDFPAQKLIKGDAYSFANRKESLFVDYALDDYNNRVPRSKWIVPSEFSPVSTPSQAELSREVDYHLFKELLLSSNDREKAMLFGISMHQAGGWQRNLAVIGTGRKMSSLEIYKITVWIWLGMKLGGNSSRCTGCGIIVENDLGDHALTCSFGKGLIYGRTLLVC